MVELIRRVGLVTVVLVAAAVLPDVGAQPIRLHPDNGHYLMWRGQATLLITSGEHYGAVLNSEFDYGKYLQTLEAEAMNLTRTFSGAYCEPVGAFGIKDNTLAPAKGKLICPWARSDQGGYRNGGNKFDLTKWDEAYFARLKDFVAQADKRGVVVELVLFCPFYKDDMWVLSPMNAANNVNGIGTMARTDVYTLKNAKLLAVQDEMVRKIVTQLKDCDNLYYEICNEPYFGGVKLEWQRHIARTIADTEKKLGVRHLIAQNIANKGKKIDDPDPLVSIFNFHYAKPPDTVGDNYGLGRVLGDDETGFSGSEPKPYRLEAWDFIIAGGGIYDNLDYSFSVGHEDGSGQISAPGGGGPEFRKQMRILKMFMRRFDFVKMRPNNSVITGGASGKTTARALAEKGKAYAIYVNGGGVKELVVDLPPGQYSVLWLDTRSGKAAGSESIEHGGGRKRLNAPKYEDDIALGIFSAR